MVSLNSVVLFVLEWIPFFRHRNTSIETLNHRRQIFENYLLSLDAIIRRLLDLRTSQPTKDTQDWLDPQTQVAVITDKDGTLITSITSLCSPSLFAYLREWQQAAHVLACIDIAVSYMSWAITEDKDPLIDHICESMMATILSFPLPEGDSPPQPRLDDVERVKDRRVFTDEPQMQSLIATLDNKRRTDLDDAAERVRARLPLVPACFRGWESK